MAQELDLIVGLLKEIRRANTSNIEGFDRLIDSINNKIELMGDNKDSAKLLKTYLEDLTKAVNEKYSITVDKFSIIENALNSLFENLDEHAKTKNIQKAYNTFNKNISDFYNQVNLQKEIIEKINYSLAAINYKKEDIIDASVLLKNNIEELNRVYKNITNSLSSNLKSILTIISESDNKKDKTNAKKQSEIINQSLSEIIESLTKIDERNNNLENLLNNIATNESLKISQGVIDLILEKSENILQKISSLASKKDIEELQNSYDEDKTSDISKEDFAKITLKAEALVNQTDEIKQKLSKITKDVEALSDTKEFESSLQNLFKKFENLSNDITKSNISDNIFDIQSKIDGVKNELSTVKNIISDINDVVVSKVITTIKNISFANESYDIKQHVTKMLSQLPQKEDIEKIINNSEINQELVNSLMQKTDIINERLDNIATLQDIEAIKENQSTIAENFQDLANKTDIDNLASKTDEIENMIDNLNFDTEFENIYKKTANIEDWLASSQLKEQTAEIAKAIPNKTDKTDLEPIIDKLNNIVELLSGVKPAENVEENKQIYSNASSSFENVRVELLNTLDMHDDTIIAKLSEIQNNLSKAITIEDFNAVSEDLKDFTNSLKQYINETSSNIEEIKQHQDNILSKLDNLDLSQVTEKVSQDIEQSTNTIQESISTSSSEIGEKVETLDKKLSSLTEYLNMDFKINEEEIIREISEIKEILENKKSNFDGIEIEKSLNVDSIEQYIEELKNILDTSDKGISPDIKQHLENIETELNNYKEFNENQFTQIIDKLNDFVLTTKSENKLPNNVGDSISEISEIKDQIQQLGESFATLTFDKNSPEGEISNFVAEKLNEISENITSLTSDFETNLQQGFAYNAELIEEKTSVLLDFIKELRHASTENIELYERLTVTDNKLMDFKQELELINTDVIDNINSKTDRLIKELGPIKELITCLAVQAPEGPQSNKIQEQLGILHGAVQDDVIECTKYAKSTYDRLEETYEQISKDLVATERNLRDFIIGDIDSVIIKVDNLKSDLEKALNSLTPPDADQMEELHQFVSQIATFKKDQQEYLKEIAEDIKTSIDKKITDQHEEIKSMLTVAMNNDAIILAIEKLKKCFKSRIKELSEIQKENANKNNATDEFSSNQYEAVFEENKNIKVINEIKEDFNKFSTLIGELSDKNPEITEVLNSIRDKIDTITVVKVDKSDNSKDFEILEDESISDEDIKEIDIDSDVEILSDTDTDNEEDDDEEDSDELFEDDDEDEEILVGANNFDFIKAFDLLKQDITNLRSDLEKYLPRSENAAPPSPSKPALSSIPSLGNNNLLMSLNNKVELLAKTLNTDWLEEIKSYLAGGEIHSLLEDINDKINILTLTDNSEWIEEIKQALEQLNNSDIGTGSNQEIQSMLALINEKIDILATSEDYDLMEDIRDAIERIYEEDLQNQSQQNEEIKKLLNTLDQKLDIIATSDNYDSIEDIKDSIDALDEKIDNITENNHSDQLDEIRDSLSLLEEKVDKITESSDFSSLDNIQDVLSTIESKIDSIIIPDNSDNNVNIEDIKYTLLGVDEKIDAINLKSLEEKVDALNLKPIEDKVEKLSFSDIKITSMLETLNHKIDIISSSEDAENTQQDIDDVKHLILAQMDYIERLEHNNKTDAFKKCLKELTLEVNNLNLNTNSTNKNLQKTLKDMKESIMAAVVTIFEQVSFIEETEEIKDFVEEKTDVINKNLVEVTKQLKQITNSNEDPDYTYSMQDIESDLAKLRLALNELQNNELESQSSELANISDTLYRITNTVEELQSSMTQDEIKDLKSDISNIQEQTQKLLISSDESYNALNSGLEDFGKIITDQISSKVDKVTTLLEKSSDSDKVMRQALIYMGEWIDSASESMNKISTNSDEIIEIKHSIDKLKKDIPEQTDILNSIEEKFDEQQERLSYFEKQINKLANIEEKFEEQQERIDRLEMTIEKILNAVEEIDDSKVTRKIDKLDKQLSKLSTNIEKLASYVD